MKKLILLITIFITFTGYSQQLAFPTAKGAGAYNTGGGSGQVIHVTTLNATGAGSLVEALNTPGARNIVFDVGGTIDLRATFGRYNFVVQQAEGAGTYDNVTIHGQTAPGGITIESSWFGFDNVRNVIWRYVRFSHDQIEGSLDDVVTMNSREQIFDHCSVTHGKDESLSIYGAGYEKDIGNITISNTLMFNNKTGMILGGTGDTGGFTVVNSAFVGTSHRFPNIGNKTSAHFDIINNLIYNYKSRWISMGAEPQNEKASTSINFIGNYYEISTISRDPSVFGMSETYTHVNANQIQEYSIDPDNVEIYTGFNVLAGNVTDSNGNNWSVPQANDQYMWTNFNYSGWPGDWNYVPLRESPWFVTTQHPLAGQAFTIKTAAQARIDILADVGANAYLDNNHNKVAYTTPTDALARDHALNDTATDDGGYKDAYVVMGEHTSSVTRPAGWDTDLDGMPDSWEITRFTDITTSDGTTDLNANGYTEFQDYVNLIDGTPVVVDVTGVTVTPATATINLASSETVTLTKTIAPANASNQGGTWSVATGHESIATVDQSGVVTPVGVGDATITYTTNFSSPTYTASTVVTVTNTITSVTGVALNKSTETVTTLDPVPLAATVTPSGANNKTIDWSSSDVNVATVDANGVVQPVGNGTAVITAASNEDNLINDTYTITISLPTGATLTSVLDDTFGDVQEADASGTVYTTSSHIKIPYDVGIEPFTNGFSFPNPGVPEGVTIESAYITFIAFNSDSDAVSVKVSLEDSDTPASFQAVNFDVTSRTLTTSNVTWTPEAWIAEQSYNTAELKTIFQEKVDDANYQITDRFNVIMEDIGGDNDFRRAYSFDSDSAKSAVLTIIYSDGTTSTVPVTSSTITTTSTSVPLNKHITVLGGVLPLNATNQTGVYSSSNEDVFIVNQDGGVELIGIGTADAEFTSNDGNFKATETITVTAPKFDLVKRLLLIRLIGM